MAIVLVACGSDDVIGADVSVASQVPTDAPTVVVTTNILGDVVERLAGDEVEVVTIMPVGADPHSFQPSAQQAASIGEAALVVANGAGFEENLLDLIEAAEADGIPVVEAIAAVETLDYGEGGAHGSHGDEHHDDEHHDDEDHSDEDHGDEHGDEDHGDEHDDEHGDEDHGDEHADEDHGDEHGDEDHGGHDHGGVDPHFFTDPVRMAAATASIANALAGLDGVDAAVITTNAAAYIAELESLDTEVEQVLSAVPKDRRVLITNHEVFGYFAERYEFEVVGTVIPSGSTGDGTSAQDLAELAEVIRAEGVPAIFSDTSSAGGLVDTLADEVGDVAVVDLYTESLGAADSDGDTYIEMVRTNADRISTALAG